MLGALSGSCDWLGAVDGTGFPQRRGRTIGVVEVLLAALRLPVPSRLACRDCRTVCVWRFGVVGWSRVSL